MFRQVGQHYIRKYHHTLIINSKQSDAKGNSSSRIFTSASSQNSNKQKNKNKQVPKKRSRNHTFSPHLSLQRYKSKFREQNGQNTENNIISDPVPKIKLNNKQIGLIISTINNGRQIVSRRSFTPTQKSHKQISVCLHCQSRTKNKCCRYYKLPFESKNKSNSNYKIDGCGQFTINQHFPEYQSKLAVVNNRPSTVARAIRSAKKDHKNHAGQIKPWQMISQSLEQQII